MSRGAREGNNAFTKDQHTSLVGQSSISPADIMQWNLSIKFIKDLALLLENRNWILPSSLVDYAFEAVR